MAGKRESAKAKRGSSLSTSRRGAARGQGKVGSERRPKVGGKGDFGIPAKHARAPLPDGGREKGFEQGTGPMRSGARGVREAGVGHAPGPVGTGSGGDVDPDVIGVGTGRGVAASPASGRTQGPDITEGGSAPFASGPPAKGRNQGRAGTHGAAKRVRGSTVDHSGGDATTSGAGTGADTTSSRGRVRTGAGRSVPDNAAAGEISTGEAGGQG